MRISDWISDVCSSDLDQILPMAKYFRGTGHILRFIVFMDVGNTNQWNRNAVYPSSEIIALLHRYFLLDPVSPSAKGEVAKRRRYVDGQGEVGVIACVTQPFCGDCTREIGCAGCGEGV